MSSDESNCTEISRVSNKDETRKEIKSHEPEQWEIDLIGNFVLFLYHRSLISNKDWCVKKSTTREEFSKFTTAEQRKKFKELNDTNDIGTLLRRCGFLLNCPRGSAMYKIKYLTLFQFRNKKLMELDNLKLNGGVIARGNNDNNEAINPLINILNNESNITPMIPEDNFEIDEDESKKPLEYQGTLMQQRVDGFCPTNMSCCICQEDFSTMENFEDHVQEHGDDTDFKFLKTMSRFDAPMFKISYSLCKNSHYFCFELETALENIMIEKIIIVQSRSFYYVDNMRVPYMIPANGKHRFFVDSHLFTIHVEQPIVLIFHQENSKDACIVEQHHFMRSADFPSINFCINPSRLPNKLLFKPKFKLSDYYPPKEILDALKDDFYHERLLKTNNEFANYIRNGKNLQAHSMKDSLYILLQIEDTDTLRQYTKLVQKNIKVRSYGDEYSFKIKPKERVFLENVLGVYDEVILTTRTDISTKENDVMQLIMQNSSDVFLKNNTFVGMIQAVNSGRISFKCDKVISIHESYTVVFRPSRINLRYQYRALESLDLRMNFLKQYLYPANIVQKPLSTISLTLFNPNINGEQLQAVRNIAEGPRNDATYIIFGPPGTGKTTTIVEAILQVLKRPETKILVTASSNSACDEIGVRLCKYLHKLDYKRAMVRIYSRSSEVRIETIDEELLENSNMYNAQFYPDVNILHEYRVVICTLSVVAKLATGKFGRRDNGGTLYTHLFIDEVAATTETEALIAVTNILTPKSCLIISGDHKQLGPILQSKRAQELGLDRSLMDRLMDRDCYRPNIDTGDYNRTIQTRLVRNYRSHPAIVSLYSGLYYNHTLEAHAKKDDVSLCEIWYRSRNKEYPIMFHCIKESSRSDNRSHSLYNPYEVNVVMDYVKDLMYFGIDGKPVSESDIGIISPYKNQYTRIREELNLRRWFSIETGSVETFQGKEKAIIIVSFVRSNTDTLGFLDNPRRLNVTISRPKSLLILIGNPNTLSLNADLEYIIKECRRNNTFIGANNVLRRTEENLKQSAENVQSALEKLTLSTPSVQDPSVGNNDREQNTTRENKNRSRKNRRRDGGVQKNRGKRSNNNESQGKFNDRKAANDGKKEEITVDSKKLDTHKIDSLFNELPKVPKPSPTTATKVQQGPLKYTKEEILKIEQEKVRQRQRWQFKNQPQQNRNLGTPNLSNNMPGHNSFVNLSNNPAVAVPLSTSQQLQYVNPFSSTARNLNETNSPNLFCFRNAGQANARSGQSHRNNRNHLNKPNILKAVAQTKEQKLANSAADKQISNNNPSISVETNKDKINENNQLTNTTIDSKGKPTPNIYPNVTNLATSSTNMHPLQSTTKIPNSNTVNKRISPASEMFEKRNVIEPSVYPNIRDITTTSSVSGSSTSSTFKRPATSSTANNQNKNVNTFTRYNVDGSAYSYRSSVPAYNPSHNFSQPRYSNSSTSNRNSYAPSAPYISDETSPVHRHSTEKKKEKESSCSIS